MKKRAQAEATLMKTKSSGAGTMFIKRRPPKPELCHFYNSSIALLKTYAMCFITSSNLFSGLF